MMGSRGTYVQTNREFNRACTFPLTHQKVKTKKKREKENELSGLSSQRMADNRTNSIC